MDKLFIIEELYLIVSDFIEVDEEEFIDFVKFNSSHFDEKREYKKGFPNLLSFKYTSLEF